MGGTQKGRIISKKIRETRPKCGSPSAQGIDGPEFNEFDQQPQNGRNNDAPDEVPYLQEKAPVSYSRNPFRFNHAPIASSTMPCCVNGRSLSSLRAVAAPRRASRCFCGSCTVRVGRDDAEAFPLVLLFTIVGLRFWYRWGVHTRTLQYSQV